MKLYTSTNFQVEQSADGRQSIRIFPDSESPKYKTYFLLVARELRLPTGKVENGTEISLGLVGKEKKTYMAFPPSKKDNRILFLFYFGRPKHRHTGCIYDELSNFPTSSLLFTTHGSGAWGSGVSGAVILEDGEWICNQSLSVWKNVGGQLVATSYDTKAEMEIAFGLVEESDIDFL